MRWGALWGAAQRRLRLDRRLQTMAGIGCVLVVGLVGWGGLLASLPVRVNVYHGSLSDDLRTKLSPPPPTRAHVRDELDCLARNVYFEARGESEMGKRAVAHVVMNRVYERHFPTTVCDVVRQGGARVRHKCQFSWWCDGRSDRPADRNAWLRSQDVAREVYWGWSKDPTRGALWYHTHQVEPVWRHALLPGAQIGNHRFYLKPEPTMQLASRAADGRD